MSVPPSARSAAGSAGAVPGRRPARPGRIDAALLLGAVAAFCAGYILAVTAPGASYAWQHNMISDLGDVGCRSFDGRWICSPRYAWFDAGLLLSGACVLTAAVRLWAIWGRLLAASTAALGVGLLVIGAVPSDVATGVHMAGAVLTLPVPAAGLLWSGVRPATTWAATFRHVRAALGVVALTLCLDHLVPGLAPVPRGVAETVAVAALLAFLALEGLRCHGARLRG